jgi:hypothetical protein
LIVCAAGAGLGVDVGVDVGATVAVAVAVAVGVVVGVGVGVAVGVGVGAGVGVSVGVDVAVGVGEGVVLGAGVGPEPQQTLGLIISEKRLSVPVSREASSTTLSVQLPFGFSPSNVDNGLSGAKFPVTPPPVPGIVETGGKPPSSSSKTVQKFRPEPPRFAIKKTVVPSGEVSLKIKSLLKACVTEAF